jgi:drug/metabolite transporter (DMT)-like permease
MASLSADARAGIALAAATLLWSGNFVAGRALRGDIDPAPLNLLRWSLCLVVFLPFVGARAWRARRVVAREWKLLVGLAATGIAAFHTLVYLALASTPAVQALLMLSLTPAAILVGAALLGGPRPSAPQWAGTLLSLVGAAVVLSRGEPAFLGTAGLGIGDLWMAVAVVLWAAYSLLLQRRPADLPGDVALAGSIVPALVMLLPWVVLAGAGAPLVVTSRLVAALAYIAVFASLVAFLLWSYGVARIGPERAGPYVHLMPVFGAVLAVPLLGEALLPSQLAGAALVFAGVALVQRRPRGAASARGLPAGIEHHQRDAAEHRRRSDEQAQRHRLVEEHDAAEGGEHRHAELHRRGAGRLEGGERRVPDGVADA